VKSLRHVEAELVSAVGGDPSPQEALLIQRAAFLVIRISLFEISTLQGEGPPADDARYLAWCNTLRLTLASLGLNRRTAPALDLRAYIAKQSEGEQS
jgi:hypothetical protein